MGIPGMEEREWAEEVKQTYLTNEKGIIISPGKFEGGPIWAPYLWRFAELNPPFWAQDEDIDEGIVVLDIDIELFPELVKWDRVVLVEDDTGFVRFLPEKSAARLETD